MNSIDKLRRGCLRVLLVSGVVVVAAIGASRFPLSRPSLYSTEISPDGRFKIEVWLEMSLNPMFILSLGDERYKSGTVYLSDLSGMKIDSVKFNTLMDRHSSWQGLNLPKSNDPNIQLFNAAMEGNISEFNKLLPKADIQFRTSHNRTFIHAAVMGDNLQILEQLLQKKIDASAKDKDSITPLEIAARNSVETVKLLLKYGADINITREIKGEKLSDGSQEKWQKTPLIAAFSGGNSELIELLIAKGADVNTGGVYQITPLQMATGRYGYFKIVGLLITKGANINAQNTFGNTALFEAIRSKAASTLNTSKFLIQRGAKVNIANKNGQTPLMLSASLPDEEPSSEEYRQTIQKLRIDLIELLLDSGADINAKDKDGKTAIDLAANLAIREYLQKKNFPTKVNIIRSQSLK